LDERFYWTEQEDELRDTFSDEFVDFLFQELHREWELSYAFIPDDRDADEFLACRDNLIEKLMKNELDQASYYLGAFEEADFNDPDLLRLVGEYNCRLQDWEYAWQAYHRLIELEPDNLDGYYRHAYVALKKGLTGRAFADYRHILSIQPEDPQALSGLAQCFALYGKINEAKSLLELVVEQHPFDLDSSIRLLEINRQLLAHYEAEAQQAPKQKDAALAIAQLYYDVNLPDRCCKTLDRYRSAIGRSSEDELLRAKALLNLDRQDEAIEMLDRAWNSAQAEGSNGYDILVRRGIVNLERSNRNAGVRDLKAALKLNPYDPVVLFELANNAYLEDRLDEGIELATRSIAMDPRPWGAYAVRCGCLFEMGKYVEALPDYRKKLEHEYDDGQAWFRKGICHMHALQYSDAVDCFRAAVEWGYEDEDASFLIAACFYNGDYEQALDSLSELQEEDPDNSDLCVMEGDIYRAMGDKDKALAVYSEAAERFPDDYYPSQRVLYMLLKAFNRNDTKKMDSHIGRLLRLEPDDEWVLAESIKLLLNLKIWKQVPLMTKRYFAELDIDGEYASEVLFYCGVALYHEGMYRESLAHLQRAYELGLRNETSIYRSAAYYKSSQLENAIVHARLACQELPDRPEYAQYLTQLEQEAAGTGRLRRGLAGLFGGGKPELPDSLKLPHQEVAEIEKLRFDLTEDEEEDEDDDE
jgi:tetratricopeptide (TPR) repeat protein